MDREPVQPSQSEVGEATNGTSPQAPTTTPTTPDASTPTTPTPPRLTPNPKLLDSPTPTLTPTTSSPPPPLTPAPSVSANVGPKMATATPGAPSPHILVPAPPKLTSTATPTLRTYSRPILPSPTGISKTPPTTQTSLRPPHSSSSSSSSSASSSVVASTTSSLLTSPSPPSSSSATHGSSTSTKTSSGLTNGRPASTSTPITPFHTPASPPGRQVSQVHPVGTPGLVRANQSLSPDRPRVSQQTLLLGKGLKGSGQDQVLLRAQMLQSLTLRSPPPGALAIPSSLRLKSPSSAPPPLSRPPAPLFPPLRPRPQPGNKATESSTTPSRHLSVPPPTLYSPVRAVPLRPRLHSPNSHRAAPPRQTSTLQPIAAAAPAGHASPISRPLKSCPLTQPVLGSGQSQRSSLSVTNPMSVTSHFERSPSAARQLQIIALSSARQPQSGPYAHTVQPPPPAVEAAELSSQTKKPSSSEDVLPLPPNPALPKSASPMPSPPSLLSPASPLSQASPPSQAPSPLQTVTQRGETKESEEQRERGQEPRHETSEDWSRDLKVESGGQGEEVKEEKPKEGSPASQREQEVAPAGEEEVMEVTEEGQSHKKGTERVDETKKEDEDETAMDQSESQTGQILHRYQNTEPGKETSTEPKEVLGLISAPVPVPVPIPAPVLDVPVQSQRLPESHRDLQPVAQEDFCENMSTQSDNQSALSSLSSQSPPSSPFITPSAENLPPLLPARPAHPTDLSLSQREVDKVDTTAAGDSQLLAGPEAETGPIGQSEDESESLNQSPSGPWEPRAWPEGRQVLTHLVEGFVIQEGLQPFPVNRSSLLVPEQVTKPQEVNGTNGKVALPIADAAAKRPEHSTDSEQDEAGDTDEPGNRPAQRDRTVLHCQFCGKRGHAHNFMRSKRFCSTSCARGFNVRLTKRLRALSAGSRSERPRPSLNRAESVPGKPLLLRLPRDLWSAGRREKEVKERPAPATAPAEDEEEGEEEEEEEEEEDMEEGGVEEEDDDSGEEEEEDPGAAMAARMERRVTRRTRRASAPVLSMTTPTTTFKPAPSQWSVEEVTAFIHTLPGCGDVAEAFRLQEIDGQALLLLTEDHLMTSMNIKLGPALKICAHINSLKNQ